MRHAHGHESTSTRKARTRQGSIIRYGAADRNRCNFGLSSTSLVSSTVGSHTAPFHTALGHVSGPCLFCAFFLSSCQHSSHLGGLLYVCPQLIPSLILSQESEIIPPEPTTWRPAEYNNPLLGVGVATRTAVNRQGLTPYSCCDANTARHSHGQVVFTAWKEFLWNRSSRRQSGR